MAEDFLTIAELADRAGVAENTARRYVRLFEEFFACRPSGRTVRYAGDDSPLLSLISSCYREGLPAPEIAARLQAVADVRRFALRTGPREQREERTAEEGDEAEARLAVLEEMRREFGMVRDTVGILWRERRAWKEGAAVLEVLAKEAASLRGELLDLRRTSEMMAARLAALEGGQDRAGAGRDALGAELARIRTAQDDLADRLARLAEAVGPEEEFLMLPLVFRSEKGEFLGVSANPRKHFSLADFLGLIDQGAGKKRNVATGWSRDGEKCWTLCMTEDPGQPRERRHRVRVRRTTTPRGNTVALIEKLSYGGRDMPVFFLYELFRQIGKDFSGTGRTRD